jgi:hypothetical protein
VAAAALEQVGEGGADRQRNAQHVGEHHRAPVLDRVLEETALGAEPGVREHRVDASERIQRCLSERLVLLEVGDVTADGDRPLLPAQLDGQLTQAGLAPRP